MNQIIIIGGGVIGLSLAYELAGRHHSVALIDINPIGRKSSWAGAGILTPSQASTAIHPLEHLEGLSNDLHRQWHQQLLQQTGIDNGYRECGGLYIARSAGEKAALIGQQAYWTDRAIDFQRLDPQQIASRFPQLCEANIPAAWWAPSEAQVRNPRHLQALQLACQQRGVIIRESVCSVKLEVRDKQTVSVAVDQEVFTAAACCLTAGAWTADLLAPFATRLPVTPVRGQMVMFKFDAPVAIPIVNEGSRYLVPRDDGFVLAGATVEEVGFCEATVDADIDELVAWAHGLIPACSPTTQVARWAGLRPGSSDGFPFLGRVPESNNTFVATGHFKSGLQLSTGTAVVMADLITGGRPTIDLQSFDPARGVIHREQFR